MELPNGEHLSAFSQLIGCELISAENGVAEVAMALAPGLLNRGGKLHGGAMFSLVDTAMGLACSTAHGFDQRSVTVECKINYLRAVDSGNVRCVATVLKAGRQLLVVEAEVFQGDKLLAKAQGTFAMT